MYNPPALIANAVSPGYNVGDYVDDPDTIAAILEGDFADLFTPLDLNASHSPALSVSVVRAVAGQPIHIRGNSAHYVPTGLNFSIDGGATWSAVTFFSVSNNVWDGYGPTYYGAQSSNIIIQDAITTSLQSPSFQFTVTNPPQFIVVNGVVVGTVTTLAPGQPATVTTSIASGVLTLNFGIPAGSSGTNGAFMNANTIPGYDSTGINDNTALIAASLTAMSLVGGGTLIINPTDYCYIASNITIPSNCTLDLGVAKAGVPQSGVFGLNSANAFSLGKGPGGCILLNGSAVITLAGNACIQNGYIVNSALPVPTSATTAQTAINAFAGTAITVTGSDCLVKNICAVGFNLFVNANDQGGRLTVLDCLDDCTNSYVVTTSGDVDRIQGCVHQAIYVSPNITTNFTPHPLSIAIRQGTFIQGGSSGTTTTDVLQIISCFSWGQQFAGTFDNLYLGAWIGGGAECGYGGWGPSGLNLSTCYGLTISGTTSMTVIGAEFSNHQYNIQNSATGIVTVSDCAFGASGGVIYHIWAQPGANMTVTNARFNAGPTPCVYIQAGIAGVQILNWAATTVFNAFQIDDAALPYVTILGNPPGGIAANSPYNGMIRGTPWQFNISNDLSTAEMFPIVNAEGNPVFPNTYIGSLSNALSSIWTYHQLVTNILNRTVLPAASFGSGHLTYATAASVNTYKVVVTNAAANAYGIWTSFPPSTVTNAGGTAQNLCNERRCCNFSGVTINMTIPSGHTFQNLAGGTIGVSMPNNAIADFCQIGATLWTFEPVSGTCTPISS